MPPLGTGASDLDSSAAEQSHVRPPDRLFQSAGDPYHTRVKGPSAQSVSDIRTGGPSEAQRGPCVQSGYGRRRRRAVGKLATRFLVGTCDLDVINRRTLAATPSSIHPSYVQVVRTGMATPGAGNDAGT
jgi:hypothetical protein